MSRVVLERPTDEIRDHLARQIVVGRSEPARENQQIASAQRIRHDRLQRRAIVAGNRLSLQVDPELVETLGDEERVRVDVGRRQHLAADRDDLCSHGPVTGLRAVRVHDNHPGARYNAPRSSRLA